MLERMLKLKEEQRLVYFPIRRRLMAVCAAHLCGIWIAGYGYVVPFWWAGILCAFLLVWAYLRFRRRESALMCMLAAMLLIGNLHAGWILSRRDLPTKPGVQISGVVSAVEKENRVYLSGVCVDGEAYCARDVLITLMTEEADVDTPKPAQVGQRISGKGRLFAPDEPRNPGGINRRYQALSDGYELSGYLLPGWTAEGNRTFSIRECLRNLRDQIKRRVGNLFCDQAPLFEGIMLGERGDMDRELSAALRLTGTAHILTVSGLHLSLISLVVSRWIRRMPFGRCAGFLLHSAFLFIFTGLTGGAPGTVRACIMAIVMEFARLRGKQYEPLTALSLAALIMTGVNPVLALNASFQFSFFVVLGIHLLVPGIRAGMSRLIRGPALLERALDMLSVSAGAQIAAAPMQLMLYGYLPLLSLPMNLISGVFMQFALLGAWAALLIGIVLPPVGEGLSALLMLGAEVFERLNLWAASLDHMILRLPSPPAFIALLFALFMLLISRRIRLGNRRKLAGCLVLLICILGYLPQFSYDTAYVQLDVGQGDAAVIRRGRHALLVDVGPEDRYDVLRYLRHEGLFADGVILTHLDEDHAGALHSLLDSEIEIPCIVMPEGAMDEEVSIVVEEALDMALLDGVDICTVKRGDTINALGIMLNVLSPTDDLIGSNERSLLLHAELEGISMLLTGDLPSDCEPVILPRCDLLKVAHHGSKYATSDVFLRMTSPRLALISVGSGNHYGHPGGRVLKALEEIGAKTLRTDEAGCITVRMKEGRMEEACFL